MAPAAEEILKDRENLTWLHLEDASFKEKANSKGLSTYLVPLGCGVTAGVLLAGLYNMSKGNSMKLQLCMRYRVLAQGVTVAIAMVAMLDVKNLFGKK